VPASAAERALAILNEQGEEATVIGAVRRGNNGVVIAG
jgi:phosphoribosylaminoimidazole (AIR) synthetase